MTVRGLELLRRAHVVVYDRLVDPRLLDEAPRARRIFAGKASGNHALPQEQINALLIVHARRGRRVVRLKGGDPFVFGRGGEEAEALARARLRWCAGAPRAPRRRSRGRSAISPAVPREHGSSLPS
jgi:siroheme synthase